MPSGGHNAKKYNDYPIPENQLTEIKSKIYATKYEAELKNYISKNFGKKGVNGLTKGLYKISSGNGFSKIYGNNEKAIGLVIEKENERRSKEGKPLLNDSEISEDELYNMMFALPPCPAGTSMFEHVINHLKTKEFGDQQPWANNLLALLYKYYNCIDGFCYVPMSDKKKMSATEKALQSWARNQRQSSKHGRKQWQTNILQTINFVGVAIDTDDYKFNKQMKRLKDHTEENGSNWPDENTQECIFLNNLKDQDHYLDQYHNNEENKNKLAALGWSYEKIMKGKRASNKDDDDWEKVQDLAAYHKKTETTNVPYPLSGHGDIKLIDLYLWKEKACSRYVKTKEGNTTDCIPLSERVRKRWKR